MSNTFDSFKEALAEAVTTVKRNIASSVDYETKYAPILNDLRRGGVLKNSTPMMAASAIRQLLSELDYTRASEELYHDEGTELIAKIDRQSAELAQAREEIEKLHLECEKRVHPWTHDQLYVQLQKVTAELIAMRAERGQAEVGGTETVEVNESQPTSPRCPSCGSDDYEYRPNDEAGKSGMWCSDCQTLHDNN